MAEHTRADLARWLTERQANCKRIAAQKTGADRDGWLEDERYFAAAVAAVNASADMREALEEANTLISCIVEAGLLPPNWNHEWTDDGGNRHTAGCMNNGSATEIRDVIRAALSKAKGEG